MDTDEHGLEIRPIRVHPCPSVVASVSSSLSLSLLAYAGSLFWSLVGGAVYAMFKHKHHLGEQETVATTDGHG